MPSGPLEPFVPTATDPWDRERAAHLARRAGFGASARELAALVDRGFESAVATFVDFEESDPAFDALAHETGGAIGDVADDERPGQPLIENVRLWWIFRMVHTRAPLREKLTLLWHDHFACQENEELRATLMLEQNRLFRRHAAGSFRELLHGVARDPAMLMYLDNRINVAAHPNENWARELMELFTLGVDRYTQRDVVEVARCFTGWTTEDDASTSFVFRPERHDPRDKSVLGRTIVGRAGADGVEEGHEVLDHLLTREECAPFVARKIARWFHDDEPDEELVDALAGVLRANDWSVRETVRALFLSRAFHDPARRFTFRRTPVDWIAGTARSLGVWNVHALRPESTTRAMGMHLFRPPSVAGWDLGPAWANAAAALARRDFAEQLSRAAHAHARPFGAPALDLDALVRGAHGGRSIVRAIAARLLLAPLSPEREAAVAEAVDRVSASGHARARAALRALVGAAESGLA